MEIIPDIALKKNKTERLACVVITDGSSSMVSSGAIHELNKGMKIFENELKKDDDTADAVQIAVLRMGDHDGVEVLTDFVDAAEFYAPVVTANGNTPLGKAVDMAMSMIEQQKQKYRQSGITYKRPWVFLMTDGEPTDEYEEVAVRARQAQESKKFTLFAVGIGDQANMDVLKEFCGKDNPPPARMSEAKFKEMFVWLSASMSSASQRPSGEQVALPSPAGWATVSV